MYSLSPHKPPIICVLMQLTLQNILILDVPLWDVNAETGNVIWPMYFNKAWPELTVTMQEMKAFLCWVEVSMMDGVEVCFNQLVEALRVQDLSI